MKTKANIKGSRACQQFEFTICLRGDVVTLERLRPLVSELRRPGLPRWQRGTRSPWETPFWFMLGVYVFVFLSMVTRAAL
jgi:hypothetical protein